MGVTFGGKALSGVAVPLAVTAEDGTVIGEVTSGIWSPRLGCNVGMSMIARGHWDPGTHITIRDSDGKLRDGTVSSLPF